MLKMVLSTPYFTQVNCFYKFHYCEILPCAHSRINTNHLDNYALLMFLITFYGTRC